MNLLRNLFANGRQLYCDPDSRCAIEAFQQQGHVLTDREQNAEILWMRKNYRSLFPRLLPDQWINHFPNETILVNKGGLTETLKRYEQSGNPTDIGLADFYQESYRLYDPEERARFFAQLPKVDQRENLWIYKPGGNSRGRGIEIMWRFNKLRRQYRKHGDRPITKKSEKGIIQRYIQKPLLLDGRKSEIRIYWMIASLDPFQVLMFPEGTVRLNSLPYQLDQFDNQLIHVTNVYQQKNHPDFDPNVELKWRYDRLDHYLAHDLGIAPSGFVNDLLVPRLEQIITWVAKAARPGLYRDYPKTGECFAVYGADLILDENLNPWLTEIQKGPGLSFHDPVKRHVIPPMLGEAARIAFEIRERRRKGKSQKNLKSVERYRWVINEAEPETVARSTAPPDFDGFRHSAGNPESVALSS